MNNETKKEKKNTGKKIAVGVAAVVAVAAIAVPTTLALTGKDSASANAGNKYTIMVSTSLDGQADYTLSVESGTKISTLRSMLKAIDGYDIAGIYKDEGLTTEYSDDEYISEDAKIFIKFEAKTYTVKVYDENKQNPVEREVDHGESLKLTATENKETDLGTYKFVGYYTVVGDTQVDLTNVTSDLEIYPKFEIEYKEYSFGYSFGDGNDYSSSIKVSVGGEEKTLNDTYHYGSTIKLRAVPSTGYEVSEFKVTVAGQTTDLLTYAYMVVEDGNLYYETELAGNGNVTITYSEVVKQAYSIGTIPDGIKVTRNGTTLANDAEIYFGDELEVSVYEDFIVSDFEITNAKHALGNTYYVTGNTEITATTTYAYSYLTFAEATDGYMVSGFDKNSGVTEVLIPATYKSEPITEIGDYVFNAATITSLKMSDNLTTIGVRAFEDSKLSKIFFGKGIRTLKSGALSYIESTSIVIPETVEYIGTEQFIGCRNLVSVEIKSKMDEIPTSFFESCESLEHFIIPEGVNKISNNAFDSCYSLTSIKIPNSVNYIGECAFNYCINLSSVFISSNVKIIDQDAFIGCDKLISVIIESAEVYAAATDTNNVGGLLANATEIRVPREIVENNENAYLMGENFAATLEDGYYTFVPASTFDYLNIDGGTINYLDDNNITEVIIPSIYKGERITTIGEEAFYGNNITSVLISEGITTIKNRAFYSCEKLKTINIPLTVTSIGNTVFFENFSLTSVNIPSSITSMGGYLFNYCTSLTEVILPEGLTAIERGMFSGCSGLANIKIPTSVTSIGDAAFYGCKSLTTLELPPNIESIGYQTFCECSNLTSIIISEGVTRIGNFAFDSCIGLTSVTIESLEIYNAVTGISSSNAGYLIKNATEIKVLKTIVDDPSNTNTFLNNEANYTRTLDGDYYVYTKV